MKCELKQQIGHTYVSIAQQAIHEAAKVKNDPKIIKLCETLDLLASEPQYHHSCYRNYTRSVATLIDMERDPKSSTDESQTHSERTQIEKSSIFQTWFDFTEKSFLKSRKITTVNDLILKLEQLLVANNASDCFQNPKSFKKKSSRRLEIEFKDIANIFLNQNGKLIFLPNTVNIEQTAEDYMELQRQHEKVMLESDKTRKLVQEAAVIIRSEVSQLKNNMSWPPTVSELNSDMVRIPNLLQHFLSYLLHGSAKPSLKASSTGQDIMYCVDNGQFITSKHILLPLP